MAENVKTKSRGTKVLLTCLSIAATLSGWAWLTATQPPAEADLVEDPSGSAQTIATPAPLQAAVVASVALPPRSTIPNLRNLPVRGLREVGDPEFNPNPPPSQSQGQPSAVRQRQNGGGGGGASQPQVQQQQPQPKPKAAHKAKPSK